MTEMCSQLPLLSCITNNSHPLLAAAAAPVRPGRNCAGGITPCRSVIISVWSPPTSSSWFLQAFPTTNSLASGRGRRGTSCPSSSALTPDHLLFGCEELKISASETAGGNHSRRSSSSKLRTGDQVLLSIISSGGCGFSSFRRTGGVNYQYYSQNERLLGIQGRRRSRGGGWGLPALGNTGGDCVGKAGRSVSCSRICGLSGGRRRFGKSEWMELFKPQLMDTVPFRFLSEYHPTPPRAVKDAISPICFFGFGQAKPVVEVVQAGDPVLHEPASEVRLEEIGSARIEKIVNDMVATMRNAPGVGLAAPQIGVHLQIIVLEDTTELMSYSSPEECEAQQRSPFDLLVIINPKLKSKSGSGSAVFFEGCLSVDGYRALVERDLEVEVTGLGRDGRPICVEASGWKARILQHECDHLSGTLYVDKMVPRTFRTKNNLRLPLPAGCPKPGVCKHSIKSLKL